MEIGCFAVAFMNQALGTEMPRASTRRAMILTTSTRPSSTSHAAHACFAKRARHAAQKFLRAAARNGDHHYAQGEGARHRREVLQRQDQKRVGKNADHNRRHTVEEVGGVADYEASAASSKLGQIDPAKESDGDADQGGKKQQLRAADNRIGHAAAGLAHRRRQLREEVPVEGAAAVKGEVAEDEKKHGNGHEGTYASEAEHHGTAKFPETQPRRHAYAPLPRRSVRRISKREIGRASCRERV